MEAMNQAEADTYARSWIEAWNTRDVEAMGDHYAESVVFRSPFIPRITGDESCVIYGREALKGYLAKGMEAYPHSRFQLHRVGIGVDIIVLNYISVEGALANEVH